HLAHGSADSGRATGHQNPRWIARTPTDRHPRYPLDVAQKSILNSVDFPIEWGHILRFARAIGDLDPAYLDPTTSVAPPTFVVASAHFDDADAWRDTAAEDIADVLHAEQHFEYRRQLRPGDVLTSVDRAGRTWQKTGRRSGPLEFREQITEFFDQ